MRVMASPFDGTPVVALPALRPDVSCVHVQWADEEGNAAFWGGHGDVKWGLWASKRVVISAEEIVPASVLRSDPHRVTIPGFMVDAVVHMPFGAMPWGLPGYYGGGTQFRVEYFAAMREDGGVRGVRRGVGGRLRRPRRRFSRTIEERYGAGALDALRVDRTWEPERPITLRVEGVEMSAQRSDHTLAEMMVVQAAREIATAGRAFVGLGLPMLATAMAKALARARARVLHRGGGGRTGSRRAR